jgi:hypothetical protein
MPPDLSTGDRAGLGLLRFFRLTEILILNLGLRLRFVLRCGLVELFVRSTSGGSGPRATARRPGRGWWVRGCGPAQLERFRVTPARI